jgi:hypothetical protein
MRILQIDCATADRWRLSAPDDPALLLQFASEMVTVLLKALERWNRQQRYLEFHS